MKPVNLLPGDAPTVAAEPGKPNFAALGGVIGGFVLLVAIAGYFAMARVDSVKSETQALNERAAAATTETAAVKSTVASLGQPIVDSDRQLAQGAEQVLVSAYGERHDFVQLAQELRGIMIGTGGWYETVEATASGEEGNTVKVVGYMPTRQLAASFDDRVAGTRTMHEPKFVDLKSERLEDLDTKRPAMYWKFEIHADLVDTVAPSAGGSGSGDAAGGTLVGADGGEGELTLSLDPDPVARKAASKAAAKKAATPAKPRNPFDIAATTAAGGGGA